MKTILFIKYLFTVIVLLGCLNVQASSSESMAKSTVSHRIYCVHDAKSEINKALYRFIISPNSLNSRQYAIEGKNTILCIKSILDDLCYRLYSIGLACPTESFKAIGIDPEGIALGFVDVNDYLHSMIKLHQYFNKIDQKVAMHWQTTNVSSAKFVSETLNEYGCSMFERKAFCVYLQDSYPTMSKSGIEKRLEYVFQIQKGRRANIVEFEYPIDYLLMAVALSAEFKTWQFLLEFGRHKAKEVERNAEFYTASISNNFRKALLAKDIWTSKIKKPELLYGKIQMYGFFDKLWTERED